MWLKLVVLTVVASSIANGLPLVDEEPSTPLESSGNARQGILEIPKEFATIVRNVIGESIKRVFFSTTLSPEIPPTKAAVAVAATSPPRVVEYAPPSPPKVYRPKPPAPLATPSPVNRPKPSAALATPSPVKVRKPTSRPDDLILEEYILNNFLITTQTPWAPTKGDPGSETLPPKTVQSAPVTESTVKSVPATEITTVKEIVSVKPTTPVKQSAPVKQSTPVKPIQGVSSIVGGRYPVYPVYPAYPPIENFYISDPSTEKPFVVVDNAFPTDFDDGVYILGIVSPSTKSPAFGRYTLRPGSGPQRLTPSGPQVVEPVESETESASLATTFDSEDLEEETTTEEDNEGGEAEDNETVV